ncbi:MAG: hypothetical protein M1279_02585 [Candidatus Marsarchaeota archaeon]|nr:hypothetical protein [Candidatus Marsarchaeota archaeon]
MSYIDRMKAKDAAMAEKRIKAANKALKHQEYVVAARNFEEAARLCVSSGNTDRCDKLSRASAAQYQNAAEKASSEGLRSNVIAIYYKDAARVLGKVNKKTQADNETITAFLKKSEQLLLRIISDSKESDGAEATAAPRAAIVHQYTSLGRVAGDEALKKEAEGKAIEEKMKNLMSNATIPKIFGIKPSFGLEKEALERGALPKEEFMRVLNTAIKEIDTDVNLKIYAMAAHKSLETAKLSARNGYDESAKDMAKRALELYTAAGKALKKDNHMGAAKIYESKANVYGFLNQKDDAKAAIKRAIDLYISESKGYSSKKKWHAALPPLEHAQKLAQAYDLDSIQSDLSARMSSIKGNIK